MAWEPNQGASEQGEQRGLLPAPAAHRSAGHSRPLLLLLRLPALLAALLAAASLLAGRAGAQRGSLRPAGALASGQALVAEEVPGSLGDEEAAGLPGHWAFQGELPSEAAAADASRDAPKQRQRLGHHKAESEKAHSNEPAGAEAHPNEPARAEAAPANATPTSAAPRARAGAGASPAEGCHTAKRGERCRDAVLWAYFTGIHTRPEWYEGLSLESKFEDFQAVFHHEGIKNCSRPCDTATELLSQKPWHDPSLLCFSVAIGYELDLIRAMVPLRASIFDCEEKTVLSTEAVDFGMGIEALLVDVVDGGMGQSGTIANVQTFINAWNVILGAGHFENHDFTVKVDPDAVLLPSRLRAHLSASAGQNVYVPNCDHRDIWPDSTDYPMMYGAVEALSQAAVKAYMEGRDRCSNELDWSRWGEDLYLGKCLQMLGAGQALDTDQVRDETCCPGDPGHCPDRKSCADGAAAAFHKFKSAEEWVECWQQAVSDEGNTQVWMS